MNLIDNYIKGICPDDGKTMHRKASIGINSGLECLVCGTINYHWNHETEMYEPWKKNDSRAPIAARNTSPQGGLVNT